MNQQAFARPWWLLPLGRLHPLWWVGIAGLLLWVDYVTGPKTQFPVVYVIPVTLAAWYSGRWPALALALAMPLVHAVFLVVLWKQRGSMAALVATTTIRGAVVIAMALWFARLSEHERELRRHVQRLEGLLPICSFCKRIRNASGEWERLEAFIAERSEAQFSHGFCPSCWKTHYAELGDAPPD
jgi:K+-sensing histidine kinase KdpD